MFADNLYLDKGYILYVPNDGHETLEEAMYKVLYSRLLKDRQSIRYVLVTDIVWKINSTMSLYQGWKKKTKKLIKLR